MRDERFGQNIGHDRVGVYRPPQTVAGGNSSTSLSKFLRDWTLVKRARFNAAKRCERKHSASIIAFALTGLFGFVVPYFLLQFKDALSQHSRDILDFTSYVTGGLSLVLGVIEQAKDYPAKARRFDLCGRRVNGAARQLLLLPPNDDRHLPQLVDQYERALEDCGDNHDDIDYELAKAEQALHDAEPSHRDTAQRRLKRVKLFEKLNVYGLYMIACLLPVAIWVGLIFYLPAPGAG